MKKRNLTLLAFSALSINIANAAPKDGQVTAGVATIHQNGLITDINQTSQNAAINWQSFNIAHNETVNFNQPNAGAVTLNRVIGNEKSVIDGAMNANGKVFISNANGMLIGKDAKINVGSLVATAANISDNDLMNGRYQFTGGQGDIENLGQISVPKGGVIALVAPIVKNGGKITAHESNALLASAENFSITLPDNANFKYTLNKGTLQGLVDNGGAILADAGRVVLTAKGVDTVKKSLIKHSGKIEANTVQNKNGVIELLGDLNNSALTVSGSLKAEAKESGDSGFIETSASQVKIEDSAVISTKSETGQTGTWLIDPKDFTVAPSGGDITGTKVSEGLQSNNVTLKSRDGAKEGKGDVIINDEINWDKNTLTLNAENDIHINKTMNGSGTAKLALEYGQNTASGDNANYYIQKGVSAKDKTVKVNLPRGGTLSIKHGLNNLNYKVVHSLSEIDPKFNESIALGVDTSVNSDEPKGYWDTGWNIYNFHGLGHSIDGAEINKDISDLTNNTRTYLTLFNAPSTIRDVKLKNVSINSNLNCVNDCKTAHTIIAPITDRATSMTGVYVQGEINLKGNYKGQLNVGGLWGEIFTPHREYMLYLSDNYTDIDINIDGFEEADISVGKLIGRDTESNSSSDRIDNSFGVGTITINGIIQGQPKNNISHYNEIPKESFNDLKEFLCKSNDEFVALDILTNKINNSQKVALCHYNRKQTKMEEKNQ